MIISGKELSDSIKAELAGKVSLFPEKYGRVPCLAVILVGEDPASMTYVRNKGRACEAVGIKNITIRLESSVSQEELLARIAELNGDPLVDGILVQLPLPGHISEDVVIRAIDPMKDVDGFRPDSPFIPCTPRGIMRLIRATGTDPDGKHAVVVGRSRIVGRPVARLLLDANATVTVCHSHTPNLAAITSTADILVVAVGKAGLVSADMVAPGAVVIDVGINRGADGKLCGDVDFQGVAPKASWITPVPGGVGPMTVCSLLENTVDSFLSKLE